MNIEDRICTLSEKPNNQLSTPISTIAIDSRKVIPNSVFVALKGYQTDGHHYLQEAVQKGAQVLVIENKKFLKNLHFTGTVCLAQNTRQLLPLLLNEFYAFPSHKMFCVGITGTNGKTTVSHILSFLLSYCGWKTGLIGTVKQGFLKTKSSYIQKNIVQAPTHINPEYLTTPHIVNLYALLNHFYKKDAQAVVMEVSSIGLDQNRTGGIDFNLAIWTNLTTDHLDYHKNMESYFQSKKILFTNQNNHFLSIINFDDPYGLKLVRDLKTTYISYGQKNAHFTWKIISSDLSSTTFQLSHNNKSTELYLPIPGIYNVPNAVAAIAATTAAGFSMKQIAAALPLFPGVRGRMEQIKLPKAPQSYIFIDYAHTPDALTTTLSFLRQHKKNRKLICVFGCGGARDKTKRPLMGAAVEKFADTIILTSDNPRTEDPEQIIQDILAGIQNKDKVTIEPDRKLAIQKTLENYKNNVILIAGKGHETEQLIGSRRISFDDRIVIKNYLQ